MNRYFKRVALSIFHNILRSAADRNPVSTPKRVLLLNPTHIGDIVISTSLVGVLKSAFPGVEIGFVTAGWSQCVIREHPLVTYSHRIDHWRMSREDVSLPEKMWRYFKTRRQALKEIRNVKYDMALHLNAGFIDLLDVSAAAGIPVRVAFDKSMWAPWATVLVAYPEEMVFKHHGECQTELLRKIGIAEKHFAERRSSLAPSSAAATAELSQLIGRPGEPLPRYVIIHMGAGASFKEMTPAFWHEVAAAHCHDLTVVFTGKGAREWQNIEHAMDGLPHCVNACDRLSWQGFVAAVRQAEALYGVDSVAGHVAAAVGTKSIHVYCGSAGVPRWRPESTKSIVWTNAVLCSPCHRKRGCAEMTCIKGIEPLQILETALTMKTAQ
jgi:ADP-heptose:LPS heptosyltransferase